MAIPVARVHLAMAHAALPALLPTPPKWKMMPLLPTPPCAVLILPVVSPPKPAAGRADADERWDARKNASRSPSKTGRADSEDRWDTHKMVKVKPCRSPAPSSPSPSGSSCSSSSSSSRHGSASSSCERWDSNKTTASVTSSSSATTPFRPSPKRASLCDSRRVGHASSAGRWDAHKKPRPPPQADGLDSDGDGRSSTGSNDVEEDMPRRAFYSGPGFICTGNVLSI